MLGLGLGLDMCGLVNITGPVTVRYLVAGRMDRTQVFQRIQLNQSHYAAAAVIFTNDHDTHCVLQQAARLLLSLSLFR